MLRFRLKRNNSANRFGEDSYFSLAFVGKPLQAVATMCAAGTARMSML